MVLVSAPQRSVRSTTAQYQQLITLDKIDEIDKIDSFNKEKSCDHQFLVFIDCTGQDAVQKGLCLRW